MTNNEIVIYIYHHINIYNFIKKVIADSTQESAEDLKQYILLYLLEYDNKKLNMLYEKNLLPQFCMKIILNQRNYYRSYYNLECRSIDKPEIPDIPYEDDMKVVMEKNNKLDFVDKELADETLDIRIKARYGLYKIYITGKYTLTELSDKYEIPYNTLFRLIKETKKIIAQRYDYHSNYIIDNKYNM